MPSVAGRIALDDETRQFALLLNSVTDYAIYMLDPDGYIRSWNPGGVRIKGYAADEIIGEHFSRFYTPEDAAAGVPQRGLDIARREGKFEAEGWRVRKDGSRFLASVVIDPIWDEGRLVGFAKVTRDITERAQAQQQLQETQRVLAQSQKMEAIGKLTLGLAHDFNNLLTVVINSLDLIDMQPEAGARTHHLVEAALRAADRGALLTRQLLAFGSGQRLVAERTDLNQLLTRSMELYRRACGGNIKVTADLAPSVPAVEVDIAQFEAAILNLVSNSRDAMPRGGSIIIASHAAHVRNPDDPGMPERDYVCISVTDDGVGIPRELQERVFEPFFTTREVGKGSGLGLSQVFGFVRQSGGFVDLESESGRGTTVRLFLPVAGHAP